MIFYRRNINKAYRRGFEEGYQKAKENFDRFMYEINEKLPMAEKMLADKFKLEVRAVEEKVLAYDFDTGEPQIRGMVYTVPDLFIRMSFTPKHKFVCVLKEDE